MNSMGMLKYVCSNVLNKQASISGLWLPALSSKRTKFIRRASTSYEGLDLQQSAPKKPMFLYITPSAIAQLKKVAKDGERLRISVDSGGCSGFEYKLSIDDRPIDVKEDELIEEQGAFVVVDKLSLDFIKGSKLDFTKDLMRSAFRITDNPLSTHGCSCGASFAPKSIE